MLFRTPAGRIAHRVNPTNTKLTLCGKSTAIGYKWAPRDLPSGERNVFASCKSCQIVEG